MQVAYKIRIYPNAVQRQHLAREFGCARWAWNTCLAWRSDAYRRGEKVTAVDFSRELTQLKKLEPYRWLNEVSSVTLVQKLRDQDRAFVNFFTKRAKYPRFKKRSHAQSVRYQIDQRIAVNMFRCGEMLKLPKIGPLKVRWSRIPEGVPKMVTLSMDATGRYFASFSVEQEIRQWPQKTNAVGVDLGVKDVAVTSDGWKSGNPRHLGRYLRRLKHAQCILSRRAKGSHRWHDQRRRVARLHARIADARKDWLHKLSTKLIRDNGFIAIEDLHVRGMMANRCLAKAIGDVGMSELRRQLEYKAAWHSRVIEAIDRFAPTSKTCSTCGLVQESMPLKVREWICECGASHDRDVNAAKNILMFSTAGNAGTYARGAGHKLEAAA
jgi:putative transposase